MSLVQDSASQILKTISRFLVAVQVCLQVAVPTLGNSQRPMEPADLQRASEIGEATFSPDGRWVAFVVNRPAATALRFDVALPFSHADIWLVPTTGGPAQNITNGESDDAGFWAPRWSPDGRYLAMLSTRNDNVRVWVWSRGIQGPKPVEDRGTTVFMSEDLHWGSIRELVIPELPVGEKQFGMKGHAELAETISRTWSDAWSGRVSTASEITSGLGTSRTPTGGQLELHLVNVETGSDVLLDKATWFASFRLSPNGLSLAYLRSVAVWHPDATMLRARRFGFLSMVYDLGIVDLEHRSAHLVRGAHDLYWGSPSWSPDSLEIAVVSSEGTTVDTDATITRCVVGARECAKLQVPVDLGLWTDKVDNSPFLWCGAHVLYLFGRAKTGDHVQMTWWKADEAGALHPFLEDSATPDQLVTGLGRTLLGLKDGALWDYDANGRRLGKVSSRLSSKIASVQPLKETDSVPSRVWLLTSEGIHEPSYLLDVPSGSITPLEKPAPTASLITYHSSKRMAIFLDADWTGARLWLTSVGTPKPERIFETNTYLREICPPVFRRLEYKSHDGQALDGWILLPEGYQPGRQYPAVTWVYLSQTFGKEPPTFETDPNNRSVFNIQLLAAHGYVVLLPSMPRKPSIQEQDVYTQLANGVLPAVDKLIGTGIVDPNRIGVMGHSFGGYSTYGLITQTNRFKAAVASAGFSDLTSYYGTFSMIERYKPTALERTLRFWLCDINASMGGPPWRDPQRYIRNSPLMFANRVNTPLLVLHGDIDPAVPIQQAEEFFSALQRQDKPVTFIRYLGEGHVIQSPANVRDLWQRIYAWFDEFLGPHRRNTSTPESVQSPN